MNCVVVVAEWSFSSSSAGRSNSSKIVVANCVPIRIRSTGSNVDNDVASMIFYSTHVLLLRIHLSLLSISKNNDSQMMLYYGIGMIQQISRTHHFDGIFGSL